MNSYEEWSAANDRYLGEALAWLRQRLESMAEPTIVETPVATRAETENVQSSFLGRFFGAPKSATPLLLPSPGEIPESVAPTAQPVPIPATMIEAESAEHPPALVVLSRRLGLSEFERLILLLCVAMELDTGAGELCAKAQRDPGVAKPYPTFALALTLFDNPAWDALAPERPLRYWRLLEINQPGALPLIAAALKADERIVHYVKGLNYLDDRLTPLVTTVTVEPGVLPPSQSKAVEAVVAHLQGAASTAQSSVLQLLGSDSLSKLMVARDAAQRLGLTLYRLSADAVPAQSADLETFARLWRREAVLLPIALYLDAAEVDRAANPQAVAIQRLLARDIGAVFLATREPWPDLGNAAATFDIAKPTPIEQQTAWADALGEAAQDQPARLVGQFNFNTTTIRKIAAHALAETAGHDCKVNDALWDGCLRHARPALDQLAQPLQPKATWPDLQIPPTEKALLQQIAHQVCLRTAVYDDGGFRNRMNRGLGISVLFAGDSGTGKTMAAEVIANELCLALYRIDLSTVVNKYIGQTEKNLRKLFDAAEDGGAILFFDEADALFGKRSEVKDSHDRYANIEVNYLLQRLEAYTGLAILASNMKSALDPAFLRRLRFIVNFPFPSATERIAIWRNAFPAETQTENLDFARLAKLNVTGGSIHNIALNAAFLAAQSGTYVTMPRVLEAARTEFRKLEKPINETDFRWLEAAGAKA